MAQVYKTAIFRNKTGIPTILGYSENTFLEMCQTSMVECVASQPAAAGPQQPILLLVAFCCC